MSVVKLKDLVYKPIMGEWGKEESENPLGDGVVNLIRTANFLSTGQINYSNITQRAILKKKKTENGELWIADYDKIDGKQLKNKDLIIEKSGGGPKTPVGRVVIFEAKKSEKFLCSNFLSVLRPKQDIVIPEFLLYQFKYLYLIDRVKKYQNQTTGLYNLKLSKYLDVEINLPSISEQSIIVAQLSKIQELIDYRIKTIRLLDDYVRSIFIEMFGDPVINEKEWSYKTLEDVVINDSISYGVVKSGDEVINGTPIIRPIDLKDEKINRDNLKFISNEISKKYSRTILKGNELLISVRGNIGSIGQATNNLKGANVSRGIIPLLFNTKEEKMFYYHYLKDKNFIIFFKKKAKGIALKQVNVSDVKKMPLFDISNNEKLLIKFYSISISVQKQKQKYQDSLNLLEVLFQSTLENAFNEDSEVDEETIFEDILPNLTTSDFKKGKRIEYLLNLLKKNKKKGVFSNLEDYNLALEKLLLLLEDGSIEQYFEKGSIKLKKSL